MSKSEIQELLDHYGVLFTEAIADKLLEIIARERADAIDEFAKRVKEEFKYYLLSNNDVDEIAEQLKEQK